MHFIKRIAAMLLAAIPSGHAVAQISGCALIATSLLCLTVDDLSAQSVVQSGTVTPGHAVRWVTSGVVGDAGTAASGSLSSLGVTNNGGPGVCVNSGPITGSYNSICLKATTANGGIIAVDNVGGATGGFSFTLNGVAQGLATVNLPVTVDDLSCFADTSGTLKDCGGTISISNRLNLGVANTNTGQLNLLNAASAFNTIIQAGAAAASRTYIWPTNFGLAKSVLSDPAGNGILAWAVPSGAASNGVVSVSSNYNVSTSDINKVLFVDATATPITIQLPAAATFGVSTITIQKADTTSNLITVLPPGGNTINGQAQVYAPLEGAAMIIQCDGATYRIISPGFAEMRGSSIRSEHTIVFANSPYPIDPTYNGYIMVVDATGGNIALTLPSLTGSNAAAFSHQSFTVDVTKYDTSTNIVTVSAFGSDTINWSESPVVLARGRDYVRFYSDGARWYIADIGGQTLAFDAGTVSAPGLYLRGEKNTGFYSPSAGILCRGLTGIAGDCFDTATGWSNPRSTSWSGIITPTQISSDQNDYNPSGLATASTLRLSSDISRAITGIVASTQGKILVLENVGASDITLTNASASSAASNRFLFSTNKTIPANTTLVVYYDQTSARWRDFSTATSVIPAAITKIDDANVTLTLGGTPATALLQPVSITAGWNGTLGASRGGFGADVSGSSGVPLFTTGVAAFTGTSGTGNFARVNTPSFTTPVIGAATGSGLALTAAAGAVPITLTTSSSDGIFTNWVGSTHTFQIGETSTGGSIKTVSNGLIDFGTNNTTRFTLSAVGGLFSAAATGGDKGVGTVNAVGLYINGAAASTTTGTVTSATVAGTSNVISVSGTCAITTTGTCTIDLAAARKTTPTTTTLSGSGTYTTPANAQWIEIVLYGAGSGGGGGGATGGASSAAGASCWNTSGAACTSPVYSAGGGASSGTSGGTGGAGGTVSGSGTCYVSMAGGTGQGFGAGGATLPGGLGGSSSIGGSGAYGGAPNNNAGNAAVAGLGGGGGGGSTSVTLIGSGGGGGATCRAIIGAPAATYTYAIGAGTAGGSAGTSGGAGGAGATGSGYVIEHYGT